jgi:glycerate 2-kinase
MPTRLFAHQLTPSLSRFRTEGLAIARAGLAAVDASSCVTAALRGILRAEAPAGRWHVCAAGKAAEPMMRAALALLPAPPATALCVVPVPPGPMPDVVEVIVGGHPVPTDGSVAAGRRALALASSCGADDMLLVLVSGGASALLALPVEGVQLAEKQETTRLLLRAGADITALNAVRKHLSRIKGGRLAAATRARTIALAISDVVGNDLSVIGSGPTVADPTTFADALAVLDRFGGRRTYPASVTAWLEAGLASGRGESPKLGDADLARVSTQVIAGQREALRGAEAEARRLGYTVTVVGEPVVGEACDAGRRHEVHLRAATAGEASRVCLLSAGETTVTVRGHGRGGRNQEFALGALSWLDGFGRDAVLVSMGTDGVDGPTDAAGAIADTTTLTRARTIGRAPEAHLAENDAYHFFLPLGDLVMTGPTGTNVGDLQVVVVA